MRLSFLLPGLALLLLTRLGYSQQLPDSTARVVALPDVTVRAHTQIQTLSPPGQSRGLHTAFGRELPPGAGVAVWHGTPDITRLYVVRAVRLRLGSRLPEGFADLPKHRRNFSEGGLRIQLCSGTLATGPMEQQLLTNPLLLTPAAAENRTGWLRLDVAAQHLVLPAQGCFVVAEGTAGPQETFVRRRSLVRPPDGQQPPEDFYFSKHDRPTGKGTRVFRYEELQQADGTLRLAAINLFPALAYRVVAAPSACHSWLRVSTGKQTQIWRAVTEQQASTRQHLPDSTIYDYNYELKLEVEEL